MEGNKAKSLFLTLLTILNLLWSSMLIFYVFNELLFASFVIDQHQQNKESWEIPFWISLFGVWLILNALLFGLDLVLLFSKNMEIPLNRMKTWLRFANWIFIFNTICFSLTIFISSIQYPFAVLVLALGSLILRFILLTQIYSIVNPERFSFFLPFRNEIINSNQTTGFKVIPFQTSDHKRPAEFIV